MKTTSLFCAIFVIFSMFPCRKEDKPGASHPSPPSQKATGRQASPVAAHPDPPRHLPHPTSDPQLTREARVKIWKDAALLLEKSNGNFTTESWRMFKERYWIPKFDHPANPGFHQGSIKDFLESVKQKPCLLEQILDIRFTKEKTAKEKEALVSLSCLSMIVAQQNATLLPIVFDGRLDDPTITYGDVVLFTVFKDALVEDPRKKEIRGLNLEHWKNMARSQNSLIRLLAVQTHHRIESIQDRWLDFHSLYVNETDPYIISEVMRIALLQPSNPKTGELLRNLRLNPVVSGNIGLRKTIRNRIDYLKEHTAKK